MRFARPATFVLTLLASLPALALEWQHVSPESQGMDSSQFASLTPRLASGELGNVAGVMIVRRGEVVFQEYFRGERGEPLPVYSVTKSVGSILLGTLVRDGLLDPATALNDHFRQLPQLRLDPLKSQITVEHLLQQRHGYDWEEWPYGREDHPIAVMLSSPDWIRTVLTWRMARPPGEEFEYSTGASTVMSGIIKDVTGQNAQAYARQALFEPLGIDDVSWGISCFAARQVCIPESDFPDGNAPLGFGLWLRLEDMARIGLMMLDDGTFDGQRILDPAWIEASTTAYSDSTSDPQVFSSEGSGYGYQWWTLAVTDRTGRTWEVYYADGYAHQFILVIPEAELVVVQQADDYSYDGPGIGTALREHILPAIQDERGSAEPLSERFNGSWYDESTPGQGLNVEILGDRGEALAYWYTYDEAGNQRWLIGQGAYGEDGVARLDFLVTTGGAFAAPPAPTLEAWATGELSFETCLTGILRFETVDGELSGEIPLTRLTGAERCVSAKVDSRLK